MGKLVTVRLSPAGLSSQVCKSLAPSRHADECSKRTLAPPRRFEPGLFKRQASGISQHLLAHLVVLPEAVAELAEEKGGEGADAAFCNFSRYHKALRGRGEAATDGRP